MAFSPDGHTLASGRVDGSVLLWDLVSDATAGDFRNLETNPGGQWAVWRSETTVTACFSSPRAGCTMHARTRSRRSGRPRTSDLRPAQHVTYTVTGPQVHADGTPVPNPQPATFDLIIGPNGEMRYVGNPKVDSLGYVNHRVTRLTWPAHEVLETPSTSGTGVVEVPAGGPDPGP